ncbi:MAG: MurR/RpiR family transcriptional regulator [Clostridiales bacterium]|nr:MurR/RpiR family transcriptional regulator [Clostridiales bacterium]
MPAKMKIRSAYATLPSAERKVADFILENSERATRMVINEIAEAAGVSVPSVTRLARKLGYSGFLDFRVALASGTANIETRKNTAILPEDDEETVIEKTYSATVNALEDTYKALDKKALIALAKAVEKADRIFLCGNASSALLAQDVATELHMLGLEAIVITDPIAMNVYKRRFEHGDVFIGISRTGRNKMLNEALKAAKQGGATCGFLCNYINAPATQIADYFFCTSRLDDFKTIMGRETNNTMFSLMNLLIILVARSIKQKQGKQAFIPETGLFEEE